MNKSVIIVIVLVVLVAGGAAIATSIGGDSGSEQMTMKGSDMKKMSETSESMELDLTSQKEVTMDIKDFEFEKSNITIKTGTKVIWTNSDSARHDVVTTDDGAEGPKSELLAKGESYEYTFTKAGTINYLCQPHPYMKGTINVVE